MRRGPDRLSTAVSRQIDLDPHSKAQAGANIRENTNGHQAPLLGAKRDQLVAHPSDNDGTLS
jgi:hypothetical protein